MLILTVSNIAAHEGNTRSPTPDSVPNYIYRRALARRAQSRRQHHLPEPGQSLLALRVVQGKFVRYAYTRSSVGNPLT